MDPTVLGALVGFFGALVALGVPLLGFLLRLDRQTRRVHHLLTGHEEMDNDGVLPRLRELEERLAAVEVAASESSSIDYDQSDALDLSR